MPTETDLVYLRLFDDRTIAVDIAREIASAMEAQGWIEWQLPMLGCNSLYSITEAGKKARRSSGNDDFRRLGRGDDGAGESPRPALGLNEKPSALKERRCR